MGQSSAERQRESALEKKKEDSGTHLVRPRFLAEARRRDTARRLDVRRELDSVVCLKEADEEERGGVVGELLADALRDEDRWMG